LVAKSLETHSVESLEAVIGAYPHITLLILHH